jgi:hypothetical protein
MFKSVDIIEELSKERQRLETSGDEFLTSALGELNDSFGREAEISQRLTGKEVGSEELILSVEQLDQLDYSLMFNEKVIQNIATRYRLRFLNSKLFLGTIPHEAKVKIKNIEEKLGEKFTTFKVLAPSSRFKLADSTEDPILFASLGNGGFYMIHKWGDDMNWYRNAINFPFRNITTLGVSCVALAMLINIFIPVDTFNELGVRSIYHAMMIKAFFGFILAGMFFVSALIFGILTSKEFSQDVWNSKYFN